VPVFEKEHASFASIRKSTKAELLNDNEKVLDVGQEDHLLNFKRNKHCLNRRF